jgi:hypothetical protein
LDFRIKASIQGLAKLSRLLLKFESEHTRLFLEDFCQHADFAATAPISSDFSQAVGESTRSKQALVLDFAYLGIDSQDFDIVACLL